MRGLLKTVAGAFLLASVAGTANAATFVAPGPSAGGTGFSDNVLAPTPLGTLSLGLNSIQGRGGVSRFDQPFCFGEFCFSISLPRTNVEAFSFTLPQGSVITSAELILTGLPPVALFSGGSFGSTLAGATLSAGASNRGFTGSGTFALDPASFAGGSAFIQPLSEIRIPDGACDDFESDDGTTCEQQFGQLVLSDYQYDLRLTTSFFAAPVPEPGTWALMLLGFGAIGTALRRRRPAALPSAA